MHKPGSRFLVLLSCVTVVALVAGCGALPTPTLAPAAPTIVAVSALPTAAKPPTPPAPTAVPPTLAPPTATALPPAALASELINLVKPTLPKPPATPGPGNMDVSAVQLKTNLGNLWLAYTIGSRGYQPLVNHFLAIYTHSPAGWQQVSRLDIPVPDYVNPQSVRQVQLDAERIWLLVEGGVGAHGGSFSLASFDGKTLRLEIEHTASSPGGSRVTDVNGDKMSDVVLDETDYYVFCYACGVRYFRYEVRSWDGTQLAEVKLAPLPASALADLRTPVNKAVALAQAGLWKEAQETMATVTSTDPTVAWNAALIRLHAEPFAKQAAGGSYPLLDHVFYGDYVAALNVMRPYTPEQLFAAKSPLVTVDIAQGGEKSISQWISKTTTLAIGVKPDLAAAYFLRGWAVNLTQPGNPAAIADIERALALAPNELLFVQSAAYLRKK